MRREQRTRADGRAVCRMLRAVASLQHHGGRPSLLGRAMQAALSEAVRGPRRGADATAVEEWAQTADPLTKAGDQWHSLVVPRSETLVEDPEDACVPTPEYIEDLVMPMVLEQQDALEDQWHTVCANCSEARDKVMLAELDTMDVGARATGAR